MTDINKEYRKILDRCGINPANCTVLHFRFNGIQNSFHFALMEAKLIGHLYDSYEDGNVYMVVPSEEKMIENIKLLAKSFGSGIDIIEL